MLVVDSFLVVADLLIGADFLADACLVGRIEEGAGDLAAPFSRMAMPYINLLALSCARLVDEYNTSWVVVDGQANGVCVCVFFFAFYIFLV